ncbi:MAG: AAA family ATPase [Oscillochloris sp.]|nr:AAA family ATPase [Oscillochloris sp.]
MQELRINTLGGLQIQVGEQALVGLASRKAEALIVYLACGGQVFQREWLAELLWDDLSSERGRANLSVLLSSLRPALGPYLQSNRLAVGLRPDAEIRLDVRFFEQALSGLLPASGEARLDTGGTEQLAAALRFYRGDFLQGFAISNSRGFEDWMRGEQERLRRLAINGRRQLARTYQLLGQPAAAIEQAELALRHDPLQEWPHLLLMELLAAIGRRAAALDAYDRYRRTLAEELGIEPADTLQTLAARLRSGFSPAPVAEKPVLRAAPLLGGSLLGREHEAAQLTTMLRDPACRLVTLIGPGGIGKTRLALHVAQQQAAAHRGGGFFLDLAGAADQTALISSLAATLGLRADGRAELRNQVLNYLHEQDLLLLCDNLEHVPQAGTLLAEILAHGPQVQLLATSRRPLNLHAEWIFPLTGLACPPAESPPQESAGYEALQLFARLAARRRRLQAGCA